MKASGGKPELWIYEDAGHGFLNEGPEGIAKRDHVSGPGAARGKGSGRTVLCAAAVRGAALLCVLRQPLASPPGLLHFNQPLARDHQNWAGVPPCMQMGFPHPPAATQQLAWERVLEFFDRTLKH